MIWNINSVGPRFSTVLVHPESSKTMLKVSDTNDSAGSSKKVVFNCSHSHKSLLDFSAATGQFFFQ